jgi:hypothetical protein
MLTRDDWHGSPRLYRPAVVCGGTLPPLPREPAWCRVCGAQLPAFRHPTQKDCLGPCHEVTRKATMKRAMKRSKARKAALKEEAVSE